MHFQTLSWPVKKEKKKEKTIYYTELQEGFFKTLVFICM